MTRSGLTLFSWLLAVLLVFFPFYSTQAAEQSCDEAGLNAAIAAGGSHTFACGGPTTITVTATKTISGTLTLDGGGLLTISGGDARQIFTVNSGVTLTLQNLTLAHGRAASPGGAINNGGTINLNTVTLADNYSAFSGGAISGGIMTITNSVVSGNQAASSGGAVSAGGQVNITTSIFSNNVASSGGAIDGGVNRVNISGSTFTGNSAANGGGALTLLGGTLNLFNTTLANNSTGSGAGGAIYLSGLNVTANIANTTFSGNTAATTGGALSSNTNQSVNITNSTFYNNQAANGGSVYQSSATGTVTIQDSILAGGSCVSDGKELTGTGNLGESSCPGIIGVPTGLDSTLANNGGPTPTHQLLPGSNAIDAALICKYRSTGTNPLFSDNTAITTDQRGANRLPPCDIGAVEYTPTVRVIDGSSATISNGGSVDYPMRRTTDAAQSKTFTIENWSGEALTLTPPSNYPSGCALVGGFPTSVPFGGSATFQVECTAGTVGQNSGVISFATSDPAFNPFSFTLYHFAQAPGVIGAGTARSCTGLAFDLALADVAAGGAPPFNCGASPATIVTTGQKNIDAAITLDGGGRIILNGGGHHRLFYIGAAGALTLKNLTLTQGYVSGSGPIASGGAIYNDAGDLTIENSTLSSNEADNGGAIYPGGGADVTVTASTFANNHARSGGGAFYVNAASTVQFVDTVFNGNTSTGNGGAILRGSATMTIRDSTFSGNTTSSGQGGALYALSGGTVSIENTLFAANAALSGGGVAVETNAAASILGSTFRDNTATQNGGALYSYGSGTIINAANSTFFHNLAPNGGMAYNDGGQLNLSSSTLSGGGSAGGLYSLNGEIWVKNSIVTAISGAACTVSGSGTITSDNNLIDGNSCPASLGAVTHLDAALDDHGGLTSTLALRHRTNAYNAAADCTYRSAGSNPLFNNGDPIAIDQRGLPRLGLCDIGAFEYYGPVITTEPQSQIVVNGQAATLTVTATGPEPLVYQWYAGDSGDTTHPLPGATTASYTTPALFFEHHYWVRVTNPEIADSLTAVLTPSVPRTVLARNYFTTQPVRLTWSGLPGAVGYELEVASDTAFAHKIPTGLDLGANALSASISVPDDGTYYWRVRAKKSPSGVSGWSATESFIVDEP